MKGLLFLTLFICANAHAHVHAYAYNAESGFVDELLTKDGRSLQCQSFNYFDELVTALDEYEYWFNMWSSGYIDKMLKFDHYNHKFVRFVFRKGHLSLLSSSEPCTEAYFDTVRDGLISYIYRLSTQYDLTAYLGEDSVDFIFFYGDLWTPFLDASLPKWLLNKQNFPVFRFDSDACQKLSGLSQRWLLMNRDQVKTAVQKQHNTMLDIMRSVPKKSIPWRQRANLAMFRGSPSHHNTECGTEDAPEDAPEPEFADDDVRVNLVQMAAKNKILKDVKFKVHDHELSGKGQQKWDNIEDFHKHHPDRFTSEFLGDMGQMRYKFIIVVDGTVSPDRMMTQLMYGSVVFKQRSFYQPMLFYDLVEYEHFIPFDNVTHLVKQLEYYVDKIEKNDEKVITQLERIAYSGFEFAMEQFNLDHTDCKVINVLKLYAKMFPKIRNNSYNLSVSASASTYKRSDSRCQEIIPEEADAFEKFSQNESQLIFSSDIDIDKVAKYWFPSMMNNTIAIGEKDPQVPVVELENAQSMMRSDYRSFADEMSTIFFVAIGSFIVMVTLLTLFATCRM